MQEETVYSPQRAVPVVTPVQDFTYVDPITQQQKTGIGTPFSGQLYDFQIAVGDEVRDTRDWSFLLHLRVACCRSH